MFSLLRRPRRSVPSPRRATATPWRPVRLELEGLESRDCPSAPVITGMSFTELPQKVVRITGTVTDDQGFANLTVNLSGVVTAPTTVNASGQFTVQVAASGLGQVTAVATDDQQQLSSAPYNLQIASTAPVISNFTAAENADGTWTFEGNVTDAVLQNETVKFGGLNGLMAQSAAVDSTTGAFTLTVTLQAGDNGTATAQVTDQWGQTSSLAEEIVRQTPSPVINNFTAVANANGTWTFSGHVTDTAQQGDTVTLGGVAALQGDTVTVDANGNFTFTAALPAGTQGMVTATASDSAGLTSNLAQTTLLTAPTAPVLNGFTAVANADGTWTFSGHVTDTAQGDTVTLGGLAALQGDTVLVDANGNFTFTAALPSGTQGMVTATAGDSAGLASNQATVALLS